MKIYTFDTTLRDGTQGESVSFSVDDKLAIAQKLDDLGIDYIEGGWPGSNPKDKQFFERASELNLRHAKLTAFGSTRFARNPVEKDPNVRELVQAGTPVISIFGKSWDLHTKRALGITEEENLALIGETVAYLVSHGKEVVYDAEHFFDGYASNPSFALRTLEAAKKNGASVLCLCDTNGGTLPHRVAELVKVVKEKFGGIVGIHAHNDSDTAVANTLMAVEAGATHVQGCINGYGERCGNANIVSIIANLELKMGHDTVGRDRLPELTSIARFIADRANLLMRGDQPFVGKSAFAHKGGVHVSAVMKDASTYEHVQPELIGNRQRVLLSDLSGRSNVSYKLDHYGFAEGLDDDARRRLLENIKEMEHQGYDFEVAEGNFELLVLQERFPDKRFFSLVGFDVATKAYGQGKSEAVASIIVNDQGHLRAATGSGQGPFDALHNALRKCLAGHYPGFDKVKLRDYKVRVLNGNRGTAAKVRVLVEWADDERTWTTVGISHDVIQASARAMLDAIRLELLRAHASGKIVEAPVPDRNGAHQDSEIHEAYGWGV
ncbi:MAG TPA: citramalate synthase [Bryobacteraceae bacterium]|nr:citramalate synthase [Bryobacteraceae bacterium]